MYNEEEVARPYARALVAIAMDEGTMDVIREDIAALEYQWETCAELREWCHTYQSLPREAHRKVVRDLWGDTFSEAIMVMLETLSVHGQLSAIPFVISTFKRLANKREGRVDVTLTFAITPEETTVAALKAKVLAAYGEKTQVAMVVDPAIGAGCIVRAGDKQIDGSLAGRLRRLRNAFASEE